MSTDKSVSGNFGIFWRGSIVTDNGDSCCWLGDNGLRLEDNGRFGSEDAGESDVDETGESDVSEVGRSGGDGLKDDGSWGGDDEATVDGGVKGWGERDGPLGDAHRGKSWGNNVTCIGGVGVEVACRSGGGEDDAYGRRNASEQDSWKRGECNVNTCPVARREDTPNFSDEGQH